MSPSPRRPLRGIPTSRAYWELKAEQMMNRVFDPDATIDLAVAAQAEPPAPLPVATPIHRLRGRPTKPAPAAATAPTRPDRHTLLLTAMGGVCMISVASSVLYLTHSSRMQQALTQERSLLLVERLRSLGPAHPAPLGAVGGTDLTSGGQPLLPLSGDPLPPPPDEPWIEQLSQLPQQEGARAPVLRVPVSPKLAAAAPPASGGGGHAERSDAPTGGGAVPELVGVVGSAGRAAAAIFQMGGSSTSVNAGEAIGGSGWRLRSADGDAALIERGGEVRRLSISNGY
ncbi:MULTISPECIES: hypothetical protein [unclassified Cyanobium]|uniref:hypothetical protein n=1 Tax=unclassified Cyanobium TaxID=2627006 RepID=UPI0020CDED9F|nr:MULTISPECIES: hypothetical protein [unclassified Cyanobium]MCP9860117.1 hypothetical protein [Cyanobium sp. Cruz-8H5]MCP9867289.1 hypothetical protein [Cyanobium sp. Cruz-8D1]